MFYRYQVCFYLDNQNLDLEHKLIIKATSSEQARNIAIAKCSPENKDFYTILIWDGISN